MALNNNLMNRNLPNEGNGYNEHEFQDISTACSCSADAENELNGAIESEASSDDDP